MGKPDNSDGMSTKEILREVRDDVKALLAGQAIQNGTIAENVHSIARHEGWLCKIDKRFWGLLASTLGIAVVGILGIALK